MSNTLSKRFSLLVVLQIPMITQGYGSAAACIFWVDRKHDLVITQTRRGRSKVFWPNLRDVIEVVDRYVPE